MPPLRSISRSPAHRMSQIPPRLVWGVKMKAPDPRMFPPRARSNSIVIYVTPFHFSPLQTMFLISLAFFVRCTLSVFRITIKNRWFAIDVPASSREGSNFKGVGRLRRIRNGGGSKNPKTQYFFLIPPPPPYTCARILNAYDQFHSFHSSASVGKTQRVNLGKDVLFSGQTPCAMPGDLPYPGCQRYPSIIAIPALC
jgi:hypothetical protein